MSFGLQTFSPSGKIQLDTTKGGLLIIDVVIFPHNGWASTSAFYYSATYPEMVGHDISYQLIPYTQVQSINTSRYPNVQITDTNGVPGISVTPMTIGAAPGLDFTGYKLIVFARPTSAPVNSFGLQMVSELDGVQLIAESSKLLRYRGYVTPYSSTVTSPGGSRNNWYRLDNTLGIPANGPVKPILFVEVAEGQYAGIYGDQGHQSGATDPTYYVAVMSSAGFVPKLFAFTPDYMDQPTTDNDYGLAIYNSGGQKVYHSNVDFKILQTLGFPAVVTPNYPGSASTPINLPASCAVPYTSRVHNVVGPDYVTFSAIGKSGNNLVTTWLVTYYGYEHDTPNLFDGPMAVIDTSQYLTV